MLPVWMNTHGFTLTISLNALKVRWLTIPKEHPPSIVSQLQRAPFHPGAICPPRHPVEEYGTIFCLFPLRFLTSSDNPQHSAVRLFECASAICT